jgi:hypothetical protein
MNTVTRQIVWVAFTILSPMVRREVIGGKETTLCPFLLASRKIQLTLATMRSAYQNAGTVSQTHGRTVSLQIRGKTFDRQIKI